MEDLIAQASALLGMNGIEHFGRGWRNRSGETSFLAANRMKASSAGESWSKTKYLMRGIL